MIYVLDTDHVSLSQRGHPLVSARLQEAGPSQVALSVITVGEQMRGWLAAIRNAATSESRVTAYARLRMAVEYFASITLLDYTQAADTMVVDLRRQGLRIGTHDLRIAAIALTHSAILVTRNARDFQQVPGLALIGLVTAVYVVGLWR